MIILIITLSLVFGLKKSDEQENKREEKQDYNNAKEDELESADTEFDFISKDLEDIGLNDNNSNNNNSKLNVINPMTQSKFPMNVSVINISKVFKRDRRTYNDINAELIKSSEEELPSIKNFIVHQSDRIIKPIIGNKSIEDTGLTSYYKSKLPFNKEVIPPNTESSAAIIAIAK